MMHLQVNDSQFQRFCGHCGQPIPLERLLKAITSRAKVFFCSDQHRFADANAKNRAAKELRAANPNRRTCPDCHGRGYTRVKRHQHGRNGEMAAQSEAAITCEQNKCRLDALATRHHRSRGMKNRYCLESRVVDEN